MNKNKPIPPQLAKRLLLRFLRDDLSEEVLGDLDEKFFATTKTKSLLRAKLNYWYQVFNYMRPFAVRKSRSSNWISYSMYQNYLKISLRNLIKQKVYSVINIGGLALGLSCFIIIMLYVQHELSFDRFHKGAGQIYRVYQQQSGNVFLGSDRFAVTPAQLASVMMDEFPEVTYATTVDDQSALLSLDDQHFWEKGMAVDHNFFNVIDYPFVVGDPGKAMKDAKSIVITKSLATKIFGEADPLGKFLKYQRGDDFTVTGVIKDPPSNSTFQFSYLINILSNQWYAEQAKRPTWNNNSFHTFIQLDQNANPADLKKKFPSMLKKYQDTEGYADYPFKDEYFLENITDMHLRSDMNMDIGLKGNKRYTYLLSLVALIVLVLACVNYTNLAIARSIKRAREVGLRKVVGAGHGQLIGQFLGESILITFISLIFGIGLTYLLLPIFGELVERPIELNFSTNTLLVPGLVLVVMMVGIFSGSYPAFVMSSLRPVDVLKGKMLGNVKRFNLQRILIIGQYAVSITLVISSLVIYYQLQFMRNKDLGYDRDHVVTIKVTDHSIFQHYDELRNEWTKNPDIIASATSGMLPTNITSSHIINDNPGGSKDDDLAIYEFRASHDFAQVFGIKVIAGRSFSSEHKTDADSYLVNETAAKALGWTAHEAVGKTVIDDGNEAKAIIGVVKDFHMHSMHLSIQPLMIRLKTDWGSYISVKIGGDNVQRTIAYLETTVKKYSPYPFDYQFLDDHFNRLYKSERKSAEIFGFFTIISILIASLGLFGLAAFMSGQRTKEIGIRKVLGASFQQIVVLLSSDFLQLVIYAFLIAIPLGWYVMHVWLQDFAYRITIEWWMFAVAGVLALVTANLTIGYQSIKASRMDPVDSLRSE